MDGWYDVGLVHEANNTSLWMQACVLLHLFSIFWLIQVRHILPLSKEVYMLLLNDVDLMHVSITCNFCLVPTRDGDTRYSPAMTMMRRGFLILAKEILDEPLA